MTREDESRDGDYLGTGWRFPPEFGPGGSNVAMVFGPEDVHQALLVLFSTRPGERAMGRAFGTDVDEFVFAGIHHDLVTRLQVAIEDAVLEHEPRVRLRRVEISADEANEGLVRVHIDYEIPEANSRFNLVFPFYLSESTMLET